MLLPIFEDFLGQAPDTASFDVVRQSIVILMGSLAKHLDKDDPKVKPIVAKLINTLSTPSQQVGIMQFFGSKQFLGHKSGKVWMRPDLEVLQL